MATKRKKTNTSNKPQTEKVTHASIEELRHLFKTWDLTTFIMVASISLVLGLAFLFFYGPQKGSNPIARHSKPVVIAANGPSLRSAVAPIMSQAKYYLLVDPDTFKLIEAVQNPYANTPTNPQQVAILVSGMGEEAVLAGSIAPQSQQILTQSGLGVHAGYTGPAKQAIRIYVLKHRNVTGHTSLGNVQSNNGMNPHAMHAHMGNPNGIQTPMQPVPNTNMMMHPRRDKMLVCPQCLFRLSVNDDQGIHPACPRCNTTMIHRETLAMFGRGGAMPNMGMQPMNMNMQNMAMQPMNMDMRGNNNNMQNMAMQPMNMDMRGNNNANMQNMALQNQKRLDGNQMDTALGITGKGRDQIVMDPNRRVLGMQNVAMQPMNMQNVGMGRRMNMGMGGNMNMMNTNNMPMNGMGVNSMNMNAMQNAPVMSNNNFTMNSMQNMPTSPMNNMNNLNMNMMMGMNNNDRGGRFSLNGINGNNGIWEDIQDRNLVCPTCSWRLSVNDDMGVHPLCSFDGSILIHRQQAGPMFRGGMQDNLNIDGNILMQHGLMPEMRRDRVLVCPQCWWQLSINNDMGIHPVCPKCKMNMVHRDRDPMMNNG
ncbi:MAG: putative Fe-Mo cluster-binding NifX family protein [Candidatus Omnitrophota bacterium]